MVYVRKSVWTLGGDFSDPVLYWYAKGVGALKQKALADITSWRFMAAIHGFDPNLWRQYGYYNPATDPLPSKALQDTYWNQCQHGSWYFLPWHRGYIWSIENLVRQEIIRQGGPADWAMPYWNYSDNAMPNARLLPPAFSRTTMPDGSANPLYVVQRWGNKVLPAGDVTLECLNEDEYTGVPGGDPGFGGVKTGFSHSGGGFGALESKPHNIVHVDIGGGTNQRPGLMSDPDTAGLDPIFWLHHANIDRLWWEWNLSSPHHTNPTDPAWLNGPLNRRFAVPDAAGQVWFYTPAQMLNPLAVPLNYRYEGLSVTTGLAAQPAATAAFAAFATNLGGPVARANPELVGASANTLAVVGGRVNAPVSLDAAPKQAVLASLNNATNALRAFASVHTAPPPSDQVLLQLENVRATGDANVIDVYINLPDEVVPEAHPELKAGSFSLFGVRKASDPAHGGMGVTQTLDITQVVSALENAGGLPDEIQVSLVPRGGADPADNITVERIGIYRHPR